MFNMYKEIAKWLKDKIMQEGDVYQSDAASEIEDKFGKEYIYDNENGNPAINKKVLAEFRTIKGSEITWERSDFYWHKKTDLDILLDDMTLGLPVMPSLPEFDDLEGLKLQ